MELKAIKCPNCGADVDIIEGKEFMFCGYCGTKIAITDENTVTIRHEDVAELKRIELEKEEAARQRKHIALMFPFVLGVVLMSFGFMAIKGETTRIEGIIMLVISVVCYALGILLFLKNHH